MCSQSKGIQPIFPAPSRTFIRETGPFQTASPPPWRCQQPAWLPGSHFNLQLNAGADSLLDAERWFCAASTGWQTGLLKSEAKEHQARQVPGSLLGSECTQKWNSTQFPYEKHRSPFGGKYVWPNNKKYLKTRAPNNSGYSLDKITSNSYFPDSLYWVNFQQ